MTGNHVVAGVEPRPFAVPAQLSAMQVRSSRQLVLETQSQREDARRERHVFPRDRVRCKERALKALVAGSQRVCPHAGPKRQVQLSDVCQFEMAVRCEDLHVGACLLLRLAAGAVCQGLAQLKEAGRNGPLAVRRLDGPTAQEDLVIPLHKATDDNQGVLVVHPRTGCAGQAFAVVALRYARFERTAAFTAELHSAMVAAARGLDGGTSLRARASEGSQGHHEAMPRQPRSVSSAKNPAVQRFRDAATGAGEAILAEGVRLVREAIDAGLQVIEAAVSPRLADPRLRDALAERADSFLECSDAMLARLSALDTPQSVAVRLARPRYEDGDLLGEELVPLVVAAAGLRDPGNLGAVMRTAEAAGATGCLTIRGGADPFRDKAVRGSMGSVFRLPVRHGLDDSEAIAFAKHHRLQIVVADGGGSCTHSEADLSKPMMLVVGAEAAGVSPQWLQAADQHVHVPLCPPVESLNVAVAAGVLLFEAQRQRQRP